MKSAALSEVKDDLSRFLRLAETEEVLITRHGKAAGVLIGFANEDDWFDYRLQNDPRFVRRIAAARASIRAGQGIPLEDLEPIPSTADSSDKPRQRTLPRAGSKRRAPRGQR